MNGYQGPRVIVGVDDSVPGLAALRFAVGEARRRGVPLHAVRARTDLVLGDFTEIDAAFAEAFGAYPDGVEVCAVRARVSGRRRCGLWTPDTQRTR
jgi:hypothetical protein